MVNWPMFFFLSFYYYYLFIWVFKIGFLYETLAVLELTL